jgi:hypothetical protein
MLSSNNLSKFTLCLNGYLDLGRYKNITANPFLRKASVDIDPLSPVLKFSIDLTVLASNGTEVPPEVTSTTLLC